MAKEFPDYKTRRVVRKTEVEAREIPSLKGLKVDELAQKFIDPDTQKPIEVGEAVEFEFDNQTTGINMLKDLMPKVYHKLEWDLNKSNKHQRVVSIEPQPPEEGKCIVWVIRLV